MRCTLWLLSLLFTAQASYQGVSNVHLEDTNDVFGMVTGTISWTLPDNMTNVVSFKPYFAVDYDSPSGNDDYTHQYGMAAGAQSNTIQEVAAPATEFHVGVTAPGYAFQRRPPWPWKGTPAEPFIYSGDAPLLVVKVLAKIGTDYQTNDQLLPQSMHVVNDAGWAGDPPLELSFIMEEGGSSSGGVEVTFVDSDTRCGYVGGAINISVPFGVDVTMLRWARIDFAEDLQGTNALTIAWVDIDLSGSVPIPADLQQGSRVYLLLVGSVNDAWEVPYGAIFQDDCGGVPNVAFNMSFTDEDPLSGVISGTVRVEIAADAADEYTSMNFYLATRASTQPTWLGSVAPLQTEFVLAGVQLNSRDLLLAYLNNSYGQQVDPVVLQIQEMITAVPSSESQVLSIQFSDEDGLFGKIAGRVTWSPGSMAVTEFFAVFAAQNASGKGQVQVSPNVSADAAHEWYINASLDTSGEPYTYLLVYPGNSIGFAASALSVHFEDSRVTCRNDAFEPCPKSQVLKDEELLPYACQGERCSAQECCTDAGTCSEFLNGTGLNASVSTGCADGFVAMQSPPEFCAGPQCQNYDCCLRTAEAMATVQSTATTWDSIQVTWSVPSLNNCTFQEYQVQLLAENSSNSTWQDVTSCELKDSCGSSCLASAVSQKPGTGAFQMKALTKAVKIGGRIVPSGAHIDSIRYVPPGTSLEDATVESPEEFLYRLSRSRFGKGGVLRDAHGVLVLEFQRPDDPLDVQMELAELILSRDEVPEEKPEGGVDAPPSGLRTRQKVEWARAMYTERAKALVWDVGEFVLPLDLRFTWPVPSLQLHVSPKPDWGCMQQVLVLSRGGQQWILQAQEVNYHLGLAGEVSVKRRRQALRNSSAQPNAEAQESFEMIDESDEDLDLDEDTESLQAMTTVRTGKSSGSRGHFGSRSAWRTKSGGVVFVHDFSCFGGTLELVGRPQDIKAVEKGELLGQQVLWHPPKRTPRPSAMQRLPGTEEKGDGTCSTMSAECPEDQPMRGWFDGQNLYWEPTPKLAGGLSDDVLKEVQSVQETVGIPKDGELPAGPWVRISSALEPGGIPGPDSGLWTLQSSFYAACYGPVPLEFLEKLGDFQAGPGARELYLRTRRDARKGKEEERERPPPEEEEVIISDESSDEDYTLEALGLVETKPTTVAFEEIIPTLKRNSQPPRLRTLDS